MSRRIEPVRRGRIFNQLFGRCPVPSPVPAFQSQASPCCPDLHRSGANPRKPPRFGPLITSLHSGSTDTESRVSDFRFQDCSDWFGLPCGDRTQNLISRSHQSGKEKKAQMFPMGGMWGHGVFGAFGWWGAPAVLGRATRRTDASRRSRK